MKSGSSGGMRCKRVAGQRGGQLAAEGGGERLARADRVGQQRAAALQVLAKLLALGVGEAEVVPAVHEHQVVAEQVRVGDVDQLGRGADVQLQLALRGGAEQVHERAGRVVAAAAVAELGDLDDAAGVRCRRRSSSASGVSKLCSLPFGSRLVA